MEYKKIKFKNKTYYLIGDIASGGAIATRYQYEHGLVSFAHLKNGEIKRFGELIGTVDDLEILGEANLKVKDDAFDNLWRNIENMMF